jgi:hypothetical protein
MINLEIGGKMRLFDRLLYTLPAQLDLLKIAA